VDAASAHLRRVLGVAPLARLLRLHLLPMDAR